MYDLVNKFVILLATPSKLELQKSIIASFFAILLVTLSPFANGAHAATLWCDIFGLGCRTPEEIERECAQIADNSLDAIIDDVQENPNVIRLNGFSSGREYVRRRWIILYEVCLENS